jgi:hypothetical protein
MHEIYSFLPYLPLLFFLMAPRKRKTSTKERVCSDPFIVDDDDDSVEGSDDDDYEELVLLCLYSLNVLY